MIAGLTLGLVLLNAVGALAARQDGLLVLAGLAATALVAFKLVNPPGPDVPMAAGLLHTASGAYMALVAALLVAGGGIVALMGQRRPGVVRARASPRPPWPPRTSRSGTPPRRPSRSGRPRGCPTPSTSRRSS